MSRARVRLQKFGSPLRRLGSFGIGLQLLPSNCIFESRRCAPAARLPFCRWSPPPTSWSPAGRIVWSLPTALMIGELSSAIPAEGGFYAWVTRALGPFWGFQEAWLSLVASIFDMAIYPTLFVAYLTRMFPWFQQGYRGWMVGLAVVIACAVLNTAGVKVVSTTSLWLFFALSAPFVAIVVLAPFKLGAL